MSNYIVKTNVQQEAGYGSQEEKSSNEIISDCFQLKDAIEEPVRRGFGIKLLTKQTEMDQRSSI